MELVKLSALFEMQYGVNLELINLTLCSNTANNAIPFVSRTEKNNGVSTFVEKQITIEPNAAHTLSVAVSGSVLSTFYQPIPYYSSFHVFILTPKRTMSVVEMLFYAKCISANKYKYSYGRQANKTLKDIFVPKSISPHLAEYLSNLLNTATEKLNQSPVISAQFDLKAVVWKRFTYGEIFDIKKGKRLIKEDFTAGTTPFIGAIDANNGYRDYIGQAPIHAGNTITVNYNGSVGEAFYQPNPFWASDDVNILYPKFRFNKYIAMFILPFIKKEKYRFSYGRKWESNRMNESIIQLPVNTEGYIDTDFMENYIKSLRYSASI